MGHLCLSLPGKGRCAHLWGKIWAWHWFRIKISGAPLMPSLMDPCSHHFTQSSRYQGAKMLRPNSRKHFLEIMSPEFCCKNGKSRAFETIFLIHIFWWEGAFCPKKFAQYLQGHWAGNLQFLWIIYLFSTLMSWKSASNRRLHPRPVLQTWVLGEIGKMRNRPTSLFVNISCFQNRIKRNEI